MDARFRRPVLPQRIVLLRHFVLPCLLGLLGLVLNAGPAQAQAGRIAGTVTDSTTGTPLPGVNVVIVGTQTGASTGGDGSYVISGLDPGAYDVQASFIGYTSQIVEDVEVSTAEATLVDIVLSESTVQLEDVVVVGYGTQRREDVTGSVSSVDVEDADIGLASSPQELIQGKAAGVQVIRNSGEPGSGMTVRIRGGTSINASNDPLYVIDGVPIDNSSITPGGYGTARNPLSFLNPNDIESIDILKDAAATAIYGARGANGVVIVTTKGGQAGQVRLDYSGAVSASTMANGLDLLSAGEYRQFINEQVDAGALPEDRLDALGEASTDWQDAITRTSISQQHSLALSGGLENTQYRASLGYTNQEGIIISSGQRTLTGRFSADRQAFDNRLQLGANLSTAYIEDDHVPYEETGGFEGAAFAGVLKFNPTYPIRDADGDFFEYSNSTRNPVAAARQINDFSETSRTIANFSAAFDVTEGLSAQLNLGGEVSRSTRRTYLPSDSPFGAPTGGRAEQDEAQRTSKLIELTTNYDNTFGSHNLNAVAGYSYQDWFDEGFGASAENFITDLWQYNNLGGGGNEGLIPYSYKSTHKLISTFGRINYNYDGRYLASLSLRRDGSSRFGPERKWGLFPSVSAAWRLSRDVSLPEVITDLKLRAGYGETGNQEIGNYLALQTLAPGFRAVFGQQVLVGVAPNQFANPNLQWEETSTFNSGIDYGLFGGRLVGALDYYRKDTDNLLVNIPVPQPAVVSSRIENVGTMRNTGFEFALEAIAVDREDLTVSLNANFATNSNEVVSLGGRDRIVYGAVSGPGLTGVQSQIIMAGLPVASFYGPVFVEINDEGQQVFEDYEDTDGDGIGDEVVGTTTAPSTEDRQIIGNPWPDLTYGLTGRVNWRSWDVSAFVRGVQGVDILNNTALTYAAKTQALTSNNFLATALDDGTALGESPVYSSRWVQNGSYLRLDYLTLGYTFDNLPQVNQARVYLRGNNLLILTPYDGFDPEVRTDNAPGLPAIGVDYLNYPRPRTFTFGVSLSF